MCPRECNGSQVFQMMIKCRTGHNSRRDQVRYSSSQKLPRHTTAPPQVDQSRCTQNFESIV